MGNIARFRQFVRSFTELMDVAGRHEVTVGDIDMVSPRVGDIHRVSNVLDDRESISIHVYGANIGAVKRHVYDLATGHSSDFISGYSSDVMPNIWDQSGNSVTA